jgi:hypothetical protein
MTNKNKQFHSKTKFDRQGGARNNPSMGNWNERNSTEPGIINITPKLCLCHFFFLHFLRTFSCSFG